ncbi:hypothetical protein FYL99_RS20255 [Escherichia coli]|nr:hypothetical protein [Escherichia coli]
MNKETRQDVPATDPVQDLDAELAQLLTEAGIGSDGLYLSNERIKAIAATDADEEKRQLASRLLHMQTHAQTLSYLRSLTGKSGVGGNIFNPLDPLDERSFVRASELSKKS